MNIKTISDKRYSNYEYYIKQPTEMVELILNLIIAQKPHLIHSLERSFNHPLIRKCCNVPFNFQ